MEDKLQCSYILMQHAESTFQYKQNHLFQSWSAPRTFQLENNENLDFR